MAVRSSSAAKMMGKLFRLNLSRRLYSSASSKNGLILGAYCEKGKDSVTFTEDAKKFDEQVGGKLSEQLKMGGALKAGKSRVFWGLDGAYPAVALAGLGAPGEGYSEAEDLHQGLEDIRIAAAAGCKALQGNGITSISVDAMGSPGRAAEGAALSLYSYQGNKAAKDRKPTPSIQLYKGSKDSWNEGIILAESQNLARTLMETPANLLTPRIFAEQTLAELSPLGVKVTIREKAWIEEKKMNSFLSVSRGSEEAPVFLELAYNCSNTAERPMVLVGKGVTFDSGGISIKPSSNMAAMRGDMGGAACVVGAIRAAAKLKLAGSIVGLIPLTENMPSGRATKPGDVVVAMNGKTILVDNTDAEGRLILADALCYSSSFNPAWIVDLATLTGAMRVALGGCAAGAFTSSAALWGAAYEAGSISGDRLWRFPLWKHYANRVTEYPNVDVHNVGKGKGGGSCTAAAFLAQFAPADIPWMHLDIASVMDETDDQPYLTKGMSGRPTRTLVELVKRPKLTV